MNLTLTDFQSWYLTNIGTAYTGDTAKVSFLLNQFLAEIKTIVPIETANITKRYKFNYCNQQYLSVPVWKTGFTVQIGERGQTSLTSLQLDTDYTVDNSLIEQDKVAGLDFSCLRCTCACEELTIRGTYGYLIPEYIINSIFGFIGELAPAPNSTVNDCDCDCEPTGKVLTSIRTGSITKTYTITNQDEAKTKSNLRNGFGILLYPPIKSWIDRAKAEFYNN